MYVELRRSHVPQIMSEHSGTLSRLPRANRLATGNPRACWAFGTPRNVLRARGDTKLAKKALNHLNNLLFLQSQIRDSKFAT